MMMSPARAGFVRGSAWETPAFPWCNDLPGRTSGQPNWQSTDSGLSIRLPRSATKRVGAGGWEAPDQRAGQLSETSDAKGADGEQRRRHRAIARQDRCMSGNPWCITHGKGSSAEADRRLAPYLVEHEQIDSVWPAWVGAGLIGL